MDTAPKKGAKRLFLGELNTTTINLYVTTFTTHAATFFVREGEITTRDGNSDNQFSLFSQCVKFP